jgi:hypothetical protein
LNKAWKISSPKANPARYSTTTSSHIGRPNAEVMTAEAMMPVASPATQWIVEPSPCFQSGRTNCSCPPGAGSWHDRTYSAAPAGPV